MSDVLYVAKSRSSGPRVRNPMKNIIVFFLTVARGSYRVNLCNIYVCVYYIYVLL